MQVGHTPSATMQPGPHIFELLPTLPKIRLAGIVALLLLLLHQAANMGHLRHHALLILGHLLHHTELFFGPSLFDFVALLLRDFHLFQLPHKVLCRHPFHINEEEAQG